MRLKQKDILAMFIDNPANEREVGYNTALINILKAEGGMITVNTLEDMTGSFEAKLRKYLPNDTFRYLDNKKIEELKSLATTGQKLNAVKVLKEYTGLGLKEAKDAIDGACSI